MLHQHIHTSVVDNESIPWVPFMPYSENVFHKYLRLDPVRGEMVVLTKTAPEAKLPRRHLSNAALVYTLNGRWKFKEHAWIAGPGSMVFETAATLHTPLTVGQSGHLTLSILTGDIVMFDGHDRPCCVENWRTSLQRYLTYCATAGITPRDLTALTEPQLI